mgnify:CR=1 FL=1|jgi:hypothetical protein
MVDTRHLGCRALKRGGSSPSFGTKLCGSSGVRAGFLYSQGRGFDSRPHNNEG